MCSNALRRALFTLIGMACASTASAGTITTWLGSGTANKWTTSGNWTTTPTTSGTFSLIYSGTPAQNTSFNNVGAVKVDSIQFRNDGSTGKTSRFTLSNPANTLSLTAGGSVTSTAAVSGTLQDTISTNLSLLGSGTFDLGSNHNLVLSGTLSSVGPLVKTGAGSLLLQGASTTLSGGLQIDGGLVQTNATSFASFNSASVSIANGSTFQINGVTGTSGASFKVRGNSTVSLTGSSNVTFSNPNFNTADPSVTTPVTLTLAGGGAGSAGTGVVQGAIQDNSGSGTVGVTIGTAAATNLWVLQGNNTYSGDTTVTTGGKLLMDGVVSGSSTTTSSGYLGGSGTFGGAVSVLSGTLSPGGLSNDLVRGVISDSIGKLTVGSLSLSSPATTAMTITGSTAGSYDQIAGSTSVNYGGTLALTLSGSYVDQTVFDLFSGFTTHTGSFSSITLSAAGTDYDGLTFSGADANGDWLSTWNGNNQALKFSQSTGQLTVVPEPSTIIFAGIGMAMFGWSTWTRRRAKARRQAIEAAIA